MTPKEFVTAIIDDIDTHADTFAANMIALGIHENEYSDWLRIFTKWMEWSTDEDRERYYGVKPCN